MKKLKILLVLFLLTILSQTVNAEEYKAQIGETKYETINAALEAAKENDTINLLSNLNEITIEEDKKITINLSNFTAKKIINKGTLTINGPGKIISTSMNHGIENWENAILIIDNNITFENESLLYFSIRNLGTATINSGNFTYDKNVTENNKHIGNEQKGNLVINNGEFKGNRLFINNGTLIINDGNFEIVESGNANTNLGTIIIKGGTFKSTNIEFISNEKGTLTIEGGTFNVKTVAENYRTGEDMKKTISIKGGTFNTSDIAFLNTSISEYAEIYMYGGEINSNTTKNIIGEYGSEESNLINILGGKINAPESSGIMLSSDSKFIIGNNDNEVSTALPYINIPNGQINRAGVPILEFYDGKIILKSKSEAKYLKIPEDYEIKYDKNDDNTYTAYLSKIGNNADDNENDNEIVDDTENDDEIINDSNDEIIEDKKNEVVDESIENPKTGDVTRNTILLLGAILIIGTITYIKLRKYSKFPQA